MTASRDRMLVGLLVVTALAVQLPALLWGVPNGKAINNAIRILDGDVPYRDFWTMYAPGHFYLGAVLFKLFGVHAWVHGAAAQALYAVDAALLFTITRRLGLERRLAMIVGFAFVLMHWGQRELTSYQTVLTLLLPAIDRVVRYAQRGGSRALVVAGILCGVGAWFKHDVAFHVAFGIVAGLSLSWYCLAGRRPDSWVSPAGVLVRIGGGAVAGALPMLLFLAWNAGYDAWRDLIVFPATDFKVVRTEPYPSLVPDGQRIVEWARAPFDLEQISNVSGYLSRWVQANVAQLVFLLGIVVLARKRRLLDPEVIAVAAVALSTMPFFWAAAHVQHNTHFSTLWIFSVLLGTLAWVRGGIRPLARVALATTFIVATVSFLERPIRQVALIAYSWRDHGKLDFPSVEGIRYARRDARYYQPIVSFIRQHVPETEAIYSGLVRHDAIVISNQSFYFLAGRRMASRYNEVHPGIVDRETTQREIIADLDRLNVRCAVLWSFGRPKKMMDDMLAQRRRSIPEIGATTLDEYFRREFQEVARFGEYVVVWRRGGAMPSPPPPNGPSS